MQDASYAKAMLAGIQAHEKINEELLAICINLSLSLAEEKPAEYSASVDPPPPASKNYKFGPRG